MSLSTLLILLGLGLMLRGLFDLTTIILNARRKRNHDEMLRFFSPDGKFMACEIADIIRERTSGKRDLPDMFVIKVLEQLYEEGKLCKEVVVVQDSSRKSTRYFLPK